MTTTTKNNLASLWLGIALATVALLPAIAQANPSFFANGVTTGSTASTSPAYLTAGVSTSTSPVYDSLAQTFSGGATAKTDVAGLLVQLTGSSTATVLSLAVEYSQDGVDWYRNYVIDPAQVGTTTSLGIGNPFAVSWKFASSSVGGAAIAANNNRATAALLIPTPFRYTRVVASMSGGNGAVWMQMVPIKEQK